MADRVLVTGPPCAGKTTWAQQNANGRPIIDRDQIARDISGTTGWTFTDTVKRQAEAEFWRRVNAGGPAVIVRSHAHDAARARADHVVTLDPGRDTLYQRAQDRPAWTREAIDDWYSRETRATQQRHHQAMRAAATRRALRG